MTDFNFTENTSFYSNSKCDEYLPITLEEINLAIRKLKTNNSPGYNNMINEYIINTPLLQQLFNVLSTGIYPDPWNLGEIIQIYKNKGDDKDPYNYQQLL